MDPHRPSHIDAVYIQRTRAQTLDFLEKLKNTTEENVDQLPACQVERKTAEVETALKRLRGILPPTKLNPTQAQPPSPPPSLSNHPSFALSSSSSSRIPSTVPQFAAVQKKVWATMLRRSDARERVVKGAIVRTFSEGGEALRPSSTGWQGVRMAKELKESLLEGRSFQELIVAKDHRAAMKEWDEFVIDEDVAKLCKWVDSLLNFFFPLIYQRYLAVSSNLTNPLFKAKFGVFHQLNINYPSDEHSVKCKVHVDGLNVCWGICVIIPFGSFESHQRYFLCVPELGIVIEFPFGCAILLPSSLLVHFNVDLSDLRVYSTEGEDLEVEIGKPPGGEYRGSLVFFSQANVFISAELGMSKGAADAIPGFDTRCTYSLDDFKNPEFFSFV